MNFIDILIILPLLYAVYKGFKQGFVIEVFTLLALFVGLYVGIHFSDFIAEWLKATFGFSSKYLPVIAFTLTFLGVGAMVYFAGKTIERLIKVVQLSLVNKIAGSFFGGLKMFYILSVILLLVEAYDEKSSFFPAEKKTSSLLYYPTVGFSNTTVPGISESTIFLKNAFKQESDSTGLTIEQISRTKDVADSLGIDVHTAADYKRIHEEYVEKKKM